MLPALALILAALSAALYGGAARVCDRPDRYGWVTCYLACQATIPALMAGYAAGAVWLAWGAWGMWSVVG